VRLRVRVCVRVRVTLPRLPHPQKLQRFGLGNALKRSVLDMITNELVGVDGGRGEVRGRPSVVQVHQVSGDAW
jgi:hypothetical protein